MQFFKCVIFSDEPLLLESLYYREREMWQNFASKKAPTKMFPSQSKKCLKKYVHIKNANFKVVFLKTKIFQSQISNFHLGCFLSNGLGYRLEWKFLLAWSQYRQLSTFSHPLQVSPSKTNKSSKCSFKPYSHKYPIFGIFDSTWSPKETRSETPFLFTFT